MVSLDCLMEQYVGKSGYSQETSVPRAQAPRMEIIVVQLIALHRSGVSIDQLLMSYTKVLEADEPTYLRLKRVTEGLTDG